MRPPRASILLITIAATVLLAGVPALAAPSARPARMQVDWSLVSAKGTVTLAVQGAWDHPYIYVEDAQTGELKRTATGTINNTITWAAPKQPLASMGFAGGECNEKRVGCSIPVHKVTGTASINESVTYADGTSAACSFTAGSLQDPDGSFFSNSSDNTMSLDMLGAGGSNVRIWMAGGYPTFAAGREPCPGEAGLSFARIPSETAPTISQTVFTKSKTGKTVTLTVTRVEPVTGKQNGTPAQVGTVTWKTTLKFKVTARYSA
jgi:hypothetical protein